MSQEQITRDSLQIARLEEQMNTMRRDMETMSEQMEQLQKQLGSVLDMLNEFRGGRKLMLGLFAGCAALASAITWGVSHIRIMP